MSSVFASADASGPPMGYPGYEQSDNSSYPQMSQHQPMTNPPMSAPMPVSSSHQQMPPPQQQQYMPPQQPHPGMQRPPIHPSQGQPMMNPSHSMPPQGGGPPGSIAPQAMPNIPGGMAPPASIQKLLDENNQYIQLLLDYQSKGRHQECGEYQRLLHRNLVYLATVADSHSQNQQNPGVANPHNLPQLPSVGSANPSSMNGPSLPDQQNS